MSPAVHCREPGRPFVVLYLGVRTIVIDATAVGIEPNRKGVTAATSALQNKRRSREPAIAGLLAGVSSGVIWCRQSGYQSIYVQGLSPIEIK